MDYSIKPPNIKKPQDETGKLPKGFNTDILPDPSKGFMLGIVAPRGSGKSVLLYNILKFYDKCFDQIEIMNPTGALDPLLSPDSLGLPEEAFHECINTDLINSIFDEQMKDREDRANKKGKKPHLKRILVVLEDCITDPNFNSNKNTNIMNKLAFRGRHAIINVIVISQYYCGLSKRFRVNIPNWIFFRTDNNKERKAIEEEQSGTTNENVFIKMYEYATREDFDFFFIHGTHPDKSMRFRRNLDNVINPKDFL